MQAAPLEAYARLRHSSKVQELLPAPTRRTELELQAHWFNGDFGNSFTTTTGESVEILQFGVWNHESGPDFIEAAVCIGAGPVRRGAIELDTEARDWEHHGHAVNPEYDGVVLHLFFNAPCEKVFTRTSAHQDIPQVQLREDTLNPGPSPTPPAAKPGLCCAPLQRWTSQEIDTLLQASARFRLEQKARGLRRIEKTHGSAEMLFQSVAIAMGYKENKLPFQLLAQRLPLGTLRAAPEKAEAMLFGLAGFLDNPDLRKYEDDTRGHVRAMWEHWWARRSELERLILPAAAWKKGGSRPANHPHRRLGALAALVRHWREFQRHMQKSTPSDAKKFLTGLEDDFWIHHYTLTSEATEVPMALIGETRARDILANVYFPLRVADEPELWNQYAEMAAPLNNRRSLTAATRLFGSVGAGKKHLRKLFHHQGLLQIYEDFCMADNSDCRDCPFPKQLASWPFRGGSEG